MKVYTTHFETDSNRFKSHIFQLHLKTPDVSAELLILSLEDAVPFVEAKNAGHVDATTRVAHLERRAEAIVVHTQGLIVTLILWDQLDTPKQNLLQYRSSRQSCSDSVLQNDTLHPKVIFDSFTRHAQKSSHHISAFRLRGIGLAQLQHTGVQVKCVGVAGDDTRSVLRCLVVLKPGSRFTVCFSFQSRNTFGVCPIGQVSVSCPEKSLGPPKRDRLEGRVPS